MCYPGANDFDNNQPGEFTMPDEEPFTTYTEVKSEWIEYDVLSSTSVLTALTSGLIASCFCCISAFARTV